MLLGDLPPGEKWRNFELKALSLRDFARVRIDQPLNPFDLARFANLIVEERRTYAVIRGEKV